MKLLLIKKCSFTGGKLLLTKNDISSLWPNVDSVLAFHISFFHLWGFDRDFSLLKQLRLLIGVTIWHQFYISNALMFVVCLSTFTWFWGFLCQKINRKRFWQLDDTTDKVWNYQLIALPLITMFSSCSSSILNQSKIVLEFSCEENRLIIVLSSKWCH